MIPPPAQVPESEIQHEQLLLVPPQRTEGEERPQSWAENTNTQTVPLQEEKSTWRVNPCGRIQGTNTSLAHTRKMCCLLRALQKGSIAADPSLKAAPAATIPNRWYIFHHWGSLKCQIYINPPLESSRGDKKPNQNQQQQNKRFWEIQTYSQDLKKNQQNKTKKNQDHSYSINTPIHSFLLMVAFMNFILVKKGNKRKKIKKIAIYRKQNKKGLKQQNLCWCFWMSSPMALNITCASRHAWKPVWVLQLQSHNPGFLLWLLEKKEPNSFILYLFNN